ncbi:MAG: hypothetical protein K0R65_47 [Crocinitomicaceae bacterium]|jgi:acetyltransferase-like isoleucine patch superfamily enzyme|nr:hypothetical protein [Crocinitomicaceae bacterium]
MIEKINFKLRTGLFRLFNKGKFKVLDGIIVRPLKIQGKEFIEVHENVIIHDQCWLGAYPMNGSTPRLVFKKGTCVGHFNHFSCAGEMIIGENVLFADKIFVTDNTHSYENVNIPVISQGVKLLKQVQIGDGAWIGENVSVIGASIGKNSIIGSNSVVTKDVPDYAIAVGNPARVIKKFNPETQAWEKV